MIVRNYYFFWCDNGIEIVFKKNLYLLEVYTEISVWKKNGRLLAFIHGFIILFLYFCVFLKISLMKS